jgi:phosphatidylinositol glycan class B
MTTSTARLGLSGFSQVRPQDLVLFVREVVLCGGAVIGLSAFSDRLYFGMWTFPPYQWLNFNITQSLAIFYGRNDWHYYLSQGLPLLLTTYLPFALLAFWSSTSIPGTQSSLVKNVRFDLAFIVCTMIATLSLISHKEVRFIYPLLPSLHILAAPHVLSFFNAQSLDSVMNNVIPRTPIKPASWRLLLLGLLIVVNVTIGLYTTQVHQRGVIDVLAFLRHEYEHQQFSQQGILLPRRTRQITTNETFAAFLMPCHSTPWRSHLVYPDLHAWALTCDPPLHIPAHTPERAAYRDEADRFYDNPLEFLKKEIETKDRPWPRYLVGFEGIRSILEQYWEVEMPEWKLEKKWTGFNSHWHDDSRRLGNVIVWELATSVTGGEMKFPTTFNGLDS